LIGRINHRETGIPLGFGTWLLQNRLQSTERKLKKLRFRQKVLRERMERSDKDRARYEAERHRLTTEIEALSQKEKSLKDQLRSSA
jgi:chromosome segregation ATPase